MNSQNIHIWGSTVTILLLITLPIDVGVGTLTHGFGIQYSDSEGQEPLISGSITIIEHNVSARTIKGEFEFEKSVGVIVEKLVRPTGLLETEIEVIPTKGQIDDLIKQIRERVAVGERILVTTLTKRMAEDLADYLSGMKIEVRYMHSEIGTLERVQILRDLRLNKFDVLVGINLLREGLDLPEVSLVAILDADKEGFLRSEVSLMQTAGRAARHLSGKVIFYADKITNSMNKVITETDRRRKKQEEYNILHNIEPK